ncbi:hypothetical protein TNCV_971891 [Trichonephila clavipes]|nr:hypothetical protein TNCV_971891 [Trichonephila clavipes]
MRLQYLEIDERLALLFLKNHTRTAREKCNRRLRTSSRRFWQLATGRLRKEQAANGAQFGRQINCDKWTKTVTRQGFRDRKISSLLRTSSRRDREGEREACIVRMLLCASALTHSLAG